MTATAAHVQGFGKGVRFDWMAGRAFKVVMNFGKDVSSGYKAAFTVRNKAGTALASVTGAGSTTNVITFGAYTTKTPITIDIPSTTIPATVAAQVADFEFLLYSSTTASNYFPLITGEIAIANDIIDTSGL